MGALGWWFLGGRSDDGSSSAAGQSCGDQRVPLAITASPAVAPILTEAAKAFDAGTASLVDGRCTTTTVTTASPEQFGETLRSALDAQGAQGAQGAAAGAGTAAPTAWVPDGSVWREVLARRPELATALPRIYAVIATSPVVVGAPKPMAEALGWPKTQPSWDDLLSLAKDPRGWGAHGHPEWGKAQLAWRDPTQDAGGLGATVSLSERVVRDAETVDDVRRSLLSAHIALATFKADLGKDFARLKDASLAPAQALRDMPIVPMTERDVNAFNATSPTIPLAALYPSDGVDPVEVPLITVRAGWVTKEQQAALDRFAEFLVTGDAARRFADAGWRTPRLLGTAPGLVGAVSSEPAYAPAAATVTDVAETLQRWSALDRPGSILVVLDVSGSMNEPVPAANNATRLDLAKASITKSLPLFSDLTAVGLWTFSRHEGSPDYNVVLDLGPLSRRAGGTTARERLQTAVAQVRAEGATGLYDTVIAAAQAAQAGWRKGSNTIVLISDGRNEDPGSATLQQVLDRISPMKKSKQPVRILSIALGDAADTSALQKISAATGGDVFVVRQAEDLDKVFLAALTE